MPRNLQGLLALRFKPRSSQRMTLGSHFHSPSLHKRVLDLVCDLYVNRFITRQIERITEKQIDIIQANTCMHTQRQKETKFRRAADQNFTEFRLMRKKKKKGPVLFILCCIFLCRLFCCSVQLSDRFIFACLCSIRCHSDLPRGSVFT